MLVLYLSFLPCYHDVPFSKTFMLCLVQAWGSDPVFSGAGFLRQKTLTNVWKEKESNIQ